MVFNDRQMRRAICHPRTRSESKQPKRFECEEIIGMESIDRRRFLLQSGAAVAAVGVATAVPAGAADALSKGRKGGRGVSLPADATLDEPVVAHLRNLRTGEVAIFKGHTEVTVKDKRLAAALFHASR
jgi:hypothetical protein